MYPLVKRINDFFIDENNVNELNSYDKVEIKLDENEWVK